MGSVVLPHLRTGWHVDQAILSEEDRLVVIRFGRDTDPDCMKMDEVLYKVADRMSQVRMFPYFSLTSLTVCTRRKKLRCDICLRPRRSPGFQRHVRAV